MQELVLREDGSKTVQAAGQIVPSTCRDSCCIGNASGGRRENKLGGQIGHGNATLCHQVWRTCARRKGIALLWPVDGDLQDGAKGKQQPCKRAPQQVGRRCALQRSRYYRRGPPKTALTFAMPSPTAFSYLTSRSCSLATVSMRRQLAGARETSPCTRA